MAAATQRRDITYDDNTTKKGRQTQRSRPASQHPRHPRPRPAHTKLAWQCMQKGSGGGRRWRWRRRRTWERARASSHGHRAMNIPPTSVGDADHAASTTPDRKRTAAHDNVHELYPWHNWWSAVKQRRRCSLAPAPWQCTSLEARWRRARGATAVASDDGSWLSGRAHPPYGQEQVQVVMVAALDGASACTDSNRTSCLVTSRHVTTNKKQQQSSKKARTTAPHVHRDAVRSTPSCLLVDWSQEQGLRWASAVRA